MPSCRQSWSRARLYRRVRICPKHFEKWVENRVFDAANARFLRCIAWQPKQYIETENRRPTYESGPTSQILPRWFFNLWFTDSLVAHAKNASGVRRHKMGNSLSLVFQTTPSATRHWRRSCFQARVSASGEGQCSCPGFDRRRASVRLFGIRSTGDCHADLIRLHSWQR